MKEILGRHGEVLNLCKRSGHIGTTGPTTVPSVQPLVGCADKVTSACGRKVYAFVFNKSGVLRLLWATIEYKKGVSQ